MEAIGVDIRIQRGAASGTTVDLFSGLVAGATVLSGSSGEILVWSDFGEFALVAVEDVEDSDTELAVTTAVDHGAVGRRFVSGVGTTSDRWLLSADGELVRVDRRGRIGQTENLGLDGGSPGIAAIGDELLVVADYGMASGVRYNVVSLGSGEKVMSLDLGEDDAVIGVHGQSVMLIDSGGQELEVVNREGTVVCSLPAPAGRLFRPINYSPTPSSSPPFQSVSSGGQILVGLADIESNNREVRQVAVADICIGSLTVNNQRNVRIKAAYISPDDQIVEFVEGRDGNDVVINGTLVGSVGRNLIAAG